MKALTREWRSQSGREGQGGGAERIYRREGDEESEETGQDIPTRPPTRHSIVIGFTNVKKELAILSPLTHPHVVRLFGVMLRPMGLVLELAPMGSLKTILSHYEEVHAKFHVRAMQRVFLQVCV